jgi:hypothetical protein
MSAVGHRLDVGPSAAFGEALAHGVAVVGAVGQQDLAGLHLLQHVLGAPAVVSLPLGHLHGRSLTIRADIRSIGMGRGFRDEAIERPGAWGRAGHARWRPEDYAPKAPIRRSDFTNRPLRDLWAKGASASKVD